MDVPVPATTFILATHYLTGDMPPPASLRGVAKQEECTQYSKVDVNNIASKNDGGSSISCKQSAWGKSLHAEQPADDGLSQQQQCSRG